MIFDSINNDQHKDTERDDINKNDVTATKSIIASNN